MTQFSAMYVISAWHDRHKCGGEWRDKDGESGQFYILTSSMPLKLHKLFLLFRTAHTCVANWEGSGENDPRQHYHSQLS